MRKIIIPLAILLSSCGGGDAPMSTIAPELHVGDVVARNPNTFGADCKTLAFPPAKYTVQATLSTGFTSVSRPEDNGGLPFLVETHCLLVETPST